MIPRIREVCCTDVSLACEAGTSLPWANVELDASDCPTAGKTTHSENTKRNAERATERIINTLTRHDTHGCRKNTYMSPS
jgi:hypothetical protein